MKTKNVIVKITQEPAAVIVDPRNIRDIRETFSCTFVVGLEGLT